MAAKTPLQLITEFSNRSGIGAFPHLNRRTVAAQLRTRFNLPFTINQQQSSLCGPASFLFSLAKKYPAKYVQYIIDLYDTGKASIGTLSVEPGTDCKNYKIPPHAISEVDWVGLAGLRDSENDFLDYESVKDEVAGITMPNNIAYWYEQAGFSSVSNETNVVFDKNLSTLLGAHKQRQNSYYVCLFVGANVFQGIKGGDAFPDHWVVLNSPITIDNQPVTNLVAKGDAVDIDDTLLKKLIDFKVFTWGQGQYSLQTNNPGVTVEQFLDYFYGYVIAK